MQKELKLFLDIFKKGESIQPLLITDDQIIEVINYLNSLNYTSFEELSEVPLANLDIFETEEKSFKISLARQIIEKSVLKSGSEFNIIVIKEIDKFTNEASNSLLKVLEDVPEGVLFLLTTNAKENILDTIKSRILFFGNNELDTFIDYDTRDLVNDFFVGNKIGFMNKIINEKIDRHETLTILNYLLVKVKTKEDCNQKLIIEKILDGIERIYSSNANPKYILDTIILEL